MRRHLHCTAQCIFTVWAMRRAFFWRSFAPRCPEIPIFCSLDTHTTMTQRMHDNADGFAAFKCAPHTDRYETGVKAAEMTIAALERGVKSEIRLGARSFPCCGRKILFNGGTHALAC